MPPVRFVLILVAVIAAAGLTVWLGALLAGMVGAPGAALPLALPALAILLVLARLLLFRRGGGPGGPGN